MNEQSLNEDIFRYVERLVNNNETLLMAIGAITLLVAVNGVLLFTHEGIGSAPLMFLAAFCMPFAYQYWFTNFHRLARFTVFMSKDYSIEEIGLAPLKDMKQFRPMPRSALRNPERPAPDKLINEIRDMARAYPELEKQLEACQAAHSVLNTYDAANLLLLQEGLRATRTPSAAIRIAAPGREQPRINA